MHFLLTNKNVDIKSLGNKKYIVFITNKIFCEQQYRFRANYSTELAATKLVNHIYEHLA